MNLKEFKKIKKKLKLKFCNNSKTNTNNNLIIIINKYNNNSEYNE